MRWKDILDIDDLVAAVLCEEDPENIRDTFLLGEGGSRRPEDCVLLLETEFCVVDDRKTNLESFCSRNSAGVKTSRLEGLTKDHVWTFDDACEDWLEFLCCWVVD